MNWRLLAYLAPERLGGALLLWTAALGAPLVLLIAAWGMSDTPFGKAVGLDSVRVRMVAIGQAAYWAKRAALGSESEREKGYVFRGYIERAQGDLLLVYLYQGSGRKRVVLRLANVREGTVNVESFAAEHRGENLIFDIYRLPEERYARAVIWRRQEPLNLKVIETGGGAERNPPTNVVDKIFARYYWRIALNGR